MPKAPLPIAAIAMLAVAGCNPRPAAAPTAAPVATAPAPAASSAPAAPTCDCAKDQLKPARANQSRAPAGVASARTMRRVVPAVTRRVEKTVVVRPAWTQTVTRPAVFRTVWRTRVIPGRAISVPTPARWRLVSERVLISPAHTVWKTSAGRPRTGVAAPGYTAVTPTGEVMCAVLVPARYAVTTRRELIAPPGLRVVQGPSRLHREAERVEVSPARTQRIQHPAVTRIVRSREVVTPERVVWVRAPASKPKHAVAPRHKRPTLCDRPSVEHRHPRGPQQVYAPPGAPPYGERG